MPRITSRFYCRGKSPHLISSPEATSLQSSPSEIVSNTALLTHWKGREPVCSALWMASCVCFLNDASHSSHYSIIQTPYIHIMLCTVYSSCSAQLCLAQHEVVVHSKHSMRLACANAVMAVYCNYFEVPKQKACMNCMQ